MSIVNRAHECISDLVFDEWMSGELDPTLEVDLKQHLQVCARCSQRRNLLQAQRNAFLERSPSWDTLAARYSGQNARQPYRRWRRSGLWALAALAATVALFVAVPRQVPNVGVRSKGGPRIGFYVKRGNQVVRGTSGEKVDPGERLRFAYSSDRATHLGIIYHDAHSATTIYPLSKRAASIQPGRNVALDFGIEIDDKLGLERVLALFCDEAIVLEPVRSALQATGHLPKLAGCRVDVVVLDKQRNP